MALVSRGARAITRAPLLTCLLFAAACSSVGEPPQEAAATTPEASSSTPASSPSTSRGDDDLSTLPPLIADARWSSREGERALRVSPTPYLRDHPSVDVAREAWRRIVVAVPEADTPGMEDQFVCHAQFAQLKSRWYLEPRRPAVGYARTVLSGCNPGDVIDVG